MRVCLLVAILVLLGGCGKKQFAEATLTPTDVLRVALDAAPATLDPALSQDLATGDVMRQVFEGLVALDADSKVVPSLAKSFKVSEDGKTYTFLLRDAKFHDGRPLNAEDVVYSFNRACSPKLRSPVARNYLGDIWGVPEVLDGKAAAITGLSAPDAKTVKIELAKAAPAFLGKLTYPVCAILPKDSVQEGLEIKHAAQMIGTGPFHIEIFVPEQAARFIRWDGYWGKVAKVKRLDMPIVKDATTRLNKFKGGELDVVGVPPEEISSVPNVEKHVRAGVVYLGLNGANYDPFRGAKVREAFAQAINKDAIVTDVLGGVAQPAHTILPPGVAGHRPDALRWRFDPSAAKTALGTVKLPPLELVLGGQSTDRRKVADAVATQLRQVLGVSVSVRQMEMGAYLQKATGQKLGFFLGSWYADYLDPENFLSVTLSQSGQNRTSYQNPQFTQLCRAADGELDPQKRIVIYQAAEDLAIGDVTWIPLYFPVDAVATGPRLSGMKRNLLGALPFSTVELK